eukprot:SAG31_NODE_95_length_25901_cov_24.763700_37_plen_86_part_00
MDTQATVASALLVRLAELQLVTCHTVHSVCQAVLPMERYVKFVRWDFTAMEQKHTVSLVQLAPFKTISEGRIAPRALPRATLVAR